LIYESDAAKSAVYGNKNYIKQINIMPSVRELEKTTRAPPYHVAEHLPARFDLRASHWMKQSVWLRTALCGGWCLRMVLYHATHS